MTAATIAPFVLTRTFNAPRQLVWDAWTKAEHLSKWFGPAGAEIISAKMDLRPGGMFHYGMKTPMGVMWGKWMFKEVVAPEKLVVVTSFSDEQAGVTRHPLAPTWPMHTLSNTTFVDKGVKTEMTLSWTPYEATPEEIATFDAGRASMTQGWGGTMASLEAYLAKIQQ